MFTYIKRTFNSAFKHMARNPWLSFASVAVILLAFFLSTLFAGLLYGSNILLKYFETQSQVLTFFNVGTDEEYIFELKEKIENYYAPESVEYTSEDSALEEFLAAYEEDELITEAITENVLPASLGIRAKDLQDIPQLISFLNDEKENSENIEEIFYREDVADKIHKISDVLRITGISLVSFLAIVSFLIILITVSITITNYSDEIEIMKLVGATPSYIRAPFVIAGATYGIIGATLAMVTMGGLLYAGYYYLNQAGMIYMIKEFFRDIPLPGFAIKEILMLIGAELGIGALMGAISSTFAIRKHLR